MQYLWYTAHFYALNHELLIYCLVLQYLNIIVKRSFATTSDKIKKLFRPGPGDIYG